MAQVVNRNHKPLKPFRSRGIDEKEARRLVVHGFFNDLIRRINVPALEAKLMDTVEAELATTVLAGV